MRFVPNKKQRRGPVYLDGSELRFTMGTMSQSLDVRRRERKGPRVPSD